jgi:acetyltransferase-like isoleucine patch superfamily enzyme
MSLEDFKKKIKLRETPFYDRLYRAADAVRHLEIPYIKGLHDFGYHERKFRVATWRNFWRAVYHQPLFRSRCAKCGKRLYIENTGQGLPFIDGDLEIYVGDNVFIYDRITLAGLTMGEKPRFSIGDNSQIAQPVAILVGNEITIGSNCIISSNLIADNPGHNLEFAERMERLDRDRIGRVMIGDYVYTGHHSQIIGRVTIGVGATIGANTVVTRDVPPFCVVASHPARIVKKLPFPEEMIEIVGDKQYRKYLEAELHQIL